MLERARRRRRAIASSRPCWRRPRQSRGAARAREALRKHGRDDDYLRTLERLAELAENDAERLMLLRRLAAEWEERRDGRRSRGGRARADPADRSARRRRVPRARARVPTGGSLAPARRGVRAADAVSRRPRRAARDLTAELARLYDEELHDPDARAPSIRRAPRRSATTARPTLAALARLHERRGAVAAAAEALEKLAAGGARARAARRGAGRAAALPMAEARRSARPPRSATRARSRSTPAT